MENVRKALENVQLQHVVSKTQSILLLEHNLTIGDALRRLAKKRVPSAPLVITPGLEDDLENMTPASTSPSLIGWIDVNDIIVDFLAYLRSGNKVLPTNMLQLMTELEKEGPVFVKKMLITVEGGEDRNLVFQADDRTPLVTAIKDLFLKKRSNGRVFHRLAVFDSQGAITSIVSQLDIIRYLVHHKAVLGDVGKLPITALGLIRSDKPVVTLGPHIPTILAFDMMLKAHVTGAAIVSDKGKVAAVLSTSDVRCIQPEHLGVLALPVAEFLALQHRTTYLGYSQVNSEQAQHPFFASGPITHHPSPQAADVPEVGAASQPEEDGMRLVTASPSSTLEEVLELMTSNMVHRVFVVMPDHKPSEVVGIVTPTDILDLLVSGL